MVVSGTRADSPPGMGQRETVLRGKVGFGAGGFLAPPGKSVGSSWERDGLSWPGLYQEGLWVVRCSQSFFLCLCGGTLSSSSVLDPPKISCLCIGSFFSYSFNNCLSGTSNNFRRINCFTLI